MQRKQDIVEQAAAWFVRLREDSISSEDREACSIWLLDSPVHVQEYLAIAQLYGALGEIDPDKEIDIGSLIPPLSE